MEKTFRKLLYTGIAVSCLLGFIFPNKDAHFWWQRIPVYDAVFGFAGAVVLIAFSKWLGHVWLMKDENYYD
ncbi:MAG: hypothetical protein C4530_15285 [Desulfobacteraceae bacterium]|nr:MAG: hypothetical protein C4530_15285 [Desulfobacteraceae bacterium]